MQSLKGLYLTAFNHSKIFVNNKVRDFYKKIPVIEFEEEIQESKNVTELDL